MRGKPFHNVIAKQAAAIFDNHGWQTSIEYRYRHNGVTNYFDIFAVKGHRKIGIEIETTPRHILDNAVKAKSLAIELWIIVPTRKLQRSAKKKLFCLAALDNHPIKILLLDNIEFELQQ